MVPVPKRAVMGALNGRQPPQPPKLSLPVCPAGGEAAATAALWMDAFVSAAATVAADGAQAAAEGDHVLPRKQKTDRGTADLRARIMSRGF